MQIWRYTMWQADVARLRGQSAPLLTFTAVEAVPRTGIRICTCGLAHHRSHQFYALNLVSRGSVSCCIISALSLAAHTVCLQFLC